MDMYRSIVHSAGEQPTQANRLHRTHTCRPIALEIPERAVVAFINHFIVSIQSFTSGRTSDLESMKTGNALRKPVSFFFPAPWCAHNIMFV